VLFQEAGGDAVLRFSALFLPLRAVAPKKKSKVREPILSRPSSEAFRSRGTRPGARAPHSSVH
jgi:hypothetical protein